jgi:hypothetical protein
MDIPAELCNLADDLDELEHVNADPDVATAIECAQYHLELLRNALDPDRQEEDDGDKRRA